MKPLVVTVLPVFWFPASPTTTTVVLFVVCVAAVWWAIRDGRSS